MATYFFCGIGGSGMSAIAQVLNARGHRVRGSDRNWDNDAESLIFRQLIAQGIELWPQDGSGVNTDIDEFVVSTAVETTIPDVARAVELGLSPRHRSAILAELINNAPSIAVGGTSGKTTVTGMIGHILTTCGQAPTIINGGVMIGADQHPRLGNAIWGTPFVVAEADESDGSLEAYRPTVSVVTNISHDHMTVPELQSLFSRFCAHATGSAVVSADCPHSTILASVSTTRTFGINREADISAEITELAPQHSRFSVNGIATSLPMPGYHNVANAVAAIAATTAVDVPISTATQAVATFQGIRRRLEVLGTHGGVTVIDDFAHNPDKIRATLTTLASTRHRRIVIFQPHGYGPTRFMWDDLIAAFSESLNDDDELTILDIYDAGGTATRTVSSPELVRAIKPHHHRSRHASSRTDLRTWLRATATSGDTIIVMGARDNTLSDFAREIDGDIAGMAATNGWA